MDRSRSNLCIGIGLTLALAATPGCSGESQTSVPLDAVPRRTPTATSTRTRTGAPPTVTSTSTALPTGTRTQTSTPPATSTVTTTSTPSPTRTPLPPADDVLTGLRNALAPLCPLFGPTNSFSVDGGGGLFQMRCTVSAGHDARVRLTLYGDEAAAAASFAEVETADCYSSIEFNDFPAVSCERPFSLGGRTLFWVWRSGCWIVSTYTFDDTPYLFAPHPRPMSEAVLEATEPFGLLSGCAPAPDPSPHPAE